MIFFSLLAYRILKRKKQRLNIIFSLFFISNIISSITNMVYALILDSTVVLFLNFLTNFFVIFGPIFLLIVNLTILESTIIFSVKRQNRYILFYGCLVFFGMLLLILLGLRFDDPNAPFFGLRIIGGRPKFGLIFFIYVVSIITGFAFIPIIRTSLKIYFSFETIALKKKWLYYFIGFLGSAIILYLIFTNNLVENETFRLVLSVYGISFILWVSLMYYGIGFKLKQQETTPNLYVY